MNQPFWSRATLERRMFRHTRAHRIAQEGLLWILATTVEQNLPLQPMIKTFALQQSTPYLKTLLHELVRELNAGTSLSLSLALIPHLIPQEQAVMIRVAEESGNLGEGLKQAAKSMTRTDADHVLRRLALYVSVVTLILLWILSFLMYYIMPKYEKIFEDFGLEFPPVTNALIECAHGFSNYGLLILPVMLYLFVGCFHFATGHPIERGPFRWLGRFFPRAKTPNLLRTLSLAVETGQPLSNAISLIAKEYPTALVKSRFLYVSNEIRHGENVWGALLQAGFLNSSDVQILETAGTAGNLSWALRELADTRQRRQEFRIRCLGESIRPVIYLVQGVLVGFVFAGFFLPLIHVISSLS